ncbi:MAG: ECF-type sigma factor [Marinomonas sp.]
MIARPTFLSIVVVDFPVRQQPDASGWKNAVTWDIKLNRGKTKVSGILDHKALMAGWQAGDREAGNRLLSDLERELNLIAAAKLAGEKNSSLSTGDLINEAVIRLSKLTKIDLQSKAHILALASRIMRQVLVDHARKRKSGKRDHAKVTLLTNVGVWDRPIELLTLDWLLDELKDMDQARADIVEMRFFGGMSIADIALVLDLSEATVKRRWVSTRAWLHDRLKD